VLRARHVHLLGHLRRRGAARGAQRRRQKHIPQFPSIVVSEKKRQAASRARPPRRRDARARTHTHTHAPARWPRGSSPPPRRPWPAPRARRRVRTDRKTCRPEAVCCRSWFAPGASARAAARGAARRAWRRLRRAGGRRRRGRAARGRDACTDERARFVPWPIVQSCGR
jgi:hypothetical protein